MAHLRAVETDLHQRELADRVEPLRNEDAVRVHRDGHAACDEPVDDLPDATVRERLAAVEAHVAHPEGVEFLERGEDLLARQLARHRRVPVAIAAREITEPRHLVREAERIRLHPEPSERATRKHRCLHRDRR